MSVNKVIIIGFAGKDADVRTFDSGSKIANIVVATTERGYTLANGTEVPERTEWHNVVARGKDADFAEKWVKKGSLLLVEGKIRTRSYDDKKTGEKKYITEIHADSVSFFNMGGKKKDEEAEHPYVQGAASEPAPVDDGSGLPF